MIDSIQKLLGVKRELPPEEFRAPVFLTGCMRSGTTFFANLLGEHPQLLHLEGELNYIWSTLGGIDCGRNRVWAGSEHIKPADAANMAAYFERCQLEFGRAVYLIWRLIHYYKKRSGGIVKSRSESRLINKSVHLVNRTDYVLNMFPEARLILLIRPIEAQVNSIKLHFESKEPEGVYMQKPERPQDSWITVKSAGQKNWEVRDLAQAWIDLNYQAILDLSKNGAEKYLILDYRKLVNSPVKTVNAVYRFLNLPEVELTMNDASRDRKVFNSQSKGDPVEGWKTSMTPEEIREIEQVKKEDESKYNYIMNSLKTL